MAVATTTVLAYAALTSAVVGGAMAYSGAQQQAKTADAVSKYNARLQERNAEQARMEGEENLRRQRQMNKRLLASQRADIATSGVAAEGSPLEVLGYNAGQLELQAQDRARAVSEGYRAGLADAASTRIDGEATASGYRRKGTASLIDSIGNTAGMGYNYRNAGAI